MRGKDGKAMDGKAMDGRKRGSIGGIVAAIILLGAVLLTGCAGSPGGDGGLSGTNGRGAEESGESIRGSAGEGGNSGEDTGVAQQGVAENEEEWLDISIGVWNGQAVLTGEDEVQKRIEEKFHIHFRPVELTWDDYWDKVPLWAMANELPDLFVGDFRSTVYYPRWIRQGLLQEIPEDLSAYPHLEECLSGDVLENAVYHGKLYCIPRKSYDARVQSSIDRMICYRWDLAQEAGVGKEPENWQEFQDMILKIIEQDPDGTGIGGMTTSDKGLLSGMFLPYSSPLAASEGAGYSWVKAEDGTYQPAYFAEDMLPAFRLVREMYEKGVIEPDIALATNTSANEKFLQGKSAAILLSGGYGNKYLSIGRYWGEKYSTEYTDDVKALKLMPDKDGEKAYPLTGIAWSESYISSSAGEEKLDRILRLYDYLLTEEGALLANYGPEGEIYEMADGKARLKEGAPAADERYPSCSVFSILARWNPSLYDDRIPSASPEAYIQVDRQRVKEAEEVEFPTYYPECTMAALELGLDFSVHPTEDILVIMTGEQPVEEMWEEIVEAYRQDGLEEVVEKVNDFLQ